MATVVRPDSYPALDMIVDYPRIPHWPCSRLLKNEPAIGIKHEWRLPITLKIRTVAGECDTVFARVLTKAGTILILEIVDEEDEVLE